MNISALKTTVVRGTHRGLLIARKYSPEILTAVGIVGGVAAAVMASKATLKIDPILNEHHGYVELIKRDVPREDPAYAKTMAFTYTRTTIELCKLYGPAIGMGAASIASIVGAHGIMRQRNAALVAAYSVLERSFNEYRKRVEAKVGEGVELELRHDIKTETRKDEKGKEVEVKVVDPTKTSVYAKFFDELNPYYQKNAEINRSFLQAQQTFANHLLHARGHVFLNEVYDALGIERTSAGAVVGWVLSPEGDNYIDFGLFDPDNYKAREFVNGFERAILLDFNVDGLIYDKI